MDTKNITRLMITTAVDRGIKEMADDPKRTLRKLADMGRQFSTGRFQPEIFEVITTILKKEDSPYYKLLQDFIFTTDFNCIKTFGINMGYDSWTYYARVLRKKSQELGFYIPWVIDFRYEPADSSHSSIQTKDMQKIIDQAQPLGCNTYCILNDGEFSTNTDIYDLFIKNEYCGFFYLLSDAQVTSVQASKLKKAANVLLLVNADSPNAKDTCQLLHDSGVLFSIYKVYNEEDIDKLSNPEYYNSLLDYHSGMIFMLKDSTCKTSAGPIIKDLRLNQEVPAILWDLLYDSNLISTILCHSDCSLRFDNDGSVYSNNDSQLNIINNDIALTDIIKKTMPEFEETDDK
ncbi:MAG: hypothetical protein K6A23_16095 [Butyrivibrio sp.]|nr:hypothetical protein [Butyrivibrio sp.]